MNLLSTLFELNWNTIMRMLLLTNIVEKIGIQGDTCDKYYWSAGIRVCHLKSPTDHRYDGSCSYESEHIGVGCKDVTQLKMLFTTTDGDMNGRAAKYVNQHLMYWIVLTYWGWEKEKNLPFHRQHFKCIFLNDFTDVFPKVRITIFHHCFRKYFGPVQVTSHYLIQWWLVYRCIYASLSLDGLKYHKT